MAAYPRRAKKRKLNKKKVAFVIIVVFAICFFINKKIDSNKAKQTEEISAPIEFEEVSSNEAEQQIPNEVETQIDNQENTKTPKKEVESSTTDWNLILINKKHEVPSDYEVNLSNIEDGHRVDSRIAESLKNMLKDARIHDVDPLICSSYRTNAQQQQLFNNKIDQYINYGYNEDSARELASYWVTNPGTSEHEIGLAVDIISKSYQELNKAQEETEVQKWLKENSYKYGFALRYPPDKSEITMINYEPWHYRYVGFESAKYMKEHDICLEEYLDWLKNQKNQ